MKFTAKGNLFNIVSIMVSDKNIRPIIIEFAIFIWSNKIENLRKSKKKKKVNWKIAIFYIWTFLLKWTNKINYYV